MPATSLEHILRQHWGFDQLRPLQREAIDAVVGRRDSLLVLPTGGGKSLCFQAPALLDDGGRGVALVVSPLIALMKDQVDGLNASGVPAARLDSSMTAAERQSTLDGLRESRFRLLYVSPERLVGEYGEGFQQQLARWGVRFVAIDEAHCISHWGHDFRPEYRQLGGLRSTFPGVSIHAFTATATARVRDDIVTQLGLRDPVVLVGDFDRPNLIYRVRQRTAFDKQLDAVIKAHHGQAGIVYCLSRRDVDTTAASLAGKGHRALPYHAGLSDEERARNQDAFLDERADIVVATVAFGMGVDRSDVRFVVHAAAPKSVEHYQQEAGRAGRDGLDAECILFYSSADFVRWKQMLETNGELTPAAVQHLRNMEAYATTMHCRHRALVEHFDSRPEPGRSLSAGTSGSFDSPFDSRVEHGRSLRAGSFDSRVEPGRPFDSRVEPGRSLRAGSCGACDWCLGELERVDDAFVLAQKIGSCVARVRQRWGIGHVTAVLEGKATPQVTAQGHDGLSTFGLLKELSGNEIRGYIEQMISSGFLARTPGEYPTVQLTPRGVALLKSEVAPGDVVLCRQPKAPPRGSRKAAMLPSVEREAWDGVDRELFEALRAVRLTVARERRVPPYVVFHDRTLREMARLRPTTPGALMQVHGVGEQKAERFGGAFLDAIQSHTGVS